MTKFYARPLATAALAIGIAVGTAGCQTMSDLDPTGLLGDDTPAPESQFPTDTSQQAEADAQTTTPDLASIPARPQAPDASAQANTAQQVTQAGTQAQYSAEALRAGTDAAAPPPLATDASATRQALASANASAPAANDLPPTASDAPPSAAPSANAAAANAPSANDLPPTAGSAPSPAASQAAASPPSAAGPSAVPAVAPQTRVASAAPPPAPAPAPAATAPMPAPVGPAPATTVAALPAPRGEPAVPAVPMTAGSMAGTRTAMVNPSDAQLGFKPSAAPPLNPGVAQWVSPPILAHYRQTAAQAGSAGTGPAVPVGPSASRGSNDAGDVVANLNSGPGSASGMATAMNGGVPPTAVIYFPGDSTGLPAAASAKVRDAVAAFKASGGTATIKVVGHASSRTPDMSVERHLEVIFQKSQARANAVAQALIKAGVPADRVQVEAVGDSQPIYYESMPKGEAGNRRAEIFVQG